MSQQKKPRRKISKCQRCGNMRERGLFIGNERICILCKKEAKELGDDQTWDWAKALCKGTSMRIGKAQGERGIYMSSLTPAMIRAVMLHQNYKCILSQMKFCLPPRDVLFTANSTLHSWNDGLSPSDQLRVPTMVRNSMSGEWEPGNIIFIVKALEPWYELMGGLYGMRQMAKIISRDEPIDVPQPGLLRKLIREAV